MGKGTGTSMEVGDRRRRQGAAAGGSSIRRGDMLAIEHTGLSKPVGKLERSWKLFTAEYKLAEPANSSVAVDSLFND